MEKSEPKGEEQKAEEPIPVIVTMAFRRPEHENELREALNGSRYKLVLWKLEQWLREETKYGLDTVRVGHLQNVRNQMHELLEDENVSLEDE